MLPTLSVVEACTFSPDSSLNEIKVGVHKAFYKMLYNVDENDIQWILTEDEATMASIGMPDDGALDWSSSSVALPQEPNLEEGSQVHAQGRACVGRLHQGTQDLNHQEERYWNPCVCYSLVLQCRAVTDELGGLQLYEEDPSLTVLDAQIVCQAAGIM